MSSGTKPYRSMFSNELLILVLIASWSKNGCCSPKHHAISRVLSAMENTGSMRLETPERRRRCVTEVDIFSNASTRFISAFA